MSMYVLEQVVGETQHTVFTSPDRSEIAHVLALIMKHRSRSAKGPTTSEHFRAAKFRLATQTDVDEILTIEGEFFRIREDTSATPTTSKQKGSHRKIAKRATRRIQGADTKDTIGTAVSKAKREASSEPRVLSNKTTIDGERFEI